MSRILAYTAPSRGNLYPLVPILDELRSRGHEIALRTLKSEVETMGARGFEAGPIAAEIEALAMDDWQARTALGAQVRASRIVCARASHDAVDLVRAIEETKPDAVIVDLLACGALSGAEAWGGPWACSCPFPLPLPSRAGPPFGLGLAPAEGTFGQLRDAVVRFLSEVGFRLFARPSLAKVRTGLGLRPVETLGEMLSLPPLHLYMTAEPFEYPRPDWQENVVMAGPCVWEPPGELPAELAEVEDPLVLVTTSTEFQDDGRLVHTAIEALAEEPLHVVATMPAWRPGGIAVPENATVLPFAPHTPILGRSICAITHGGMGATQKALARGVPVCAVPFGRDQPEVARRVEVAAAGVRLPARRLTPRRLRAKVREATACRPGAERIARAFAAAGGAPAGADAVERRLLDVLPS